METFIQNVTNIDFGILDFIQQNLRNPFFDFLMPFFSAIGEAGIVWIVICVGMLFPKKTRMWAVAGLVAMLVTWLSGEVILKNLIGRVRPCNVNLAVDMLVDRPSSYSFPSGHTSSSFACATVIFRMNKKWGIGALILAALIGFSRLYNYVHFPTDVLAGMLWGILLASVVVWVFKKYNLFDDKKDLNLNK